MQSEPMASKNKVLRPAIIVSHRIISEYSTYLEHLIVGLADESIPIALVCPADSNVDQLISGGVQVIEHPLIDLPLMERLGRNSLLEQLEKFKPTVLHCLCQSKAQLTSWLARRLSLPYVLMVDSLRPYRISSFLSFKSCARIYVPAGSIATNLSKIYPYLADRIVQINMGAFLDDHTLCFSEPSFLATMVMAHPLINAVDFENIFAALKHLKIDNYEFMLAIMGKGHAEERVWRLLSALDLTESITVVPHLRPLRSVLAAGDIFIQPQPNQTFNPILLEAMSVGTAVAACKGGVDDLILPDKTAVVFDPDDQISIRSALQRLLDGRDFARQLARSTQQYVRENHSVSSMISAILQMYNEVQT